MTAKHREIFLRVAGTAFETTLAAVLSGGSGFLVMAIFYNTGLDLVYTLALTFATVGAVSWTYGKLRGGLSQKSSY